MITYRTYEQLTHICDNVSARPWGKLSRSVWQLFIIFCNIGNCLWKGRLERAWRVRWCMFEYWCPQFNTVCPSCLDILLYQRPVWVSVETRCLSRSALAELHIRHYCTYHTYTNYRNTGLPVFLTTCMVLRQIVIGNAGAILTCGEWKMFKHLSVKLYD